MNFLDNRLFYEKFFLFPAYFRPFRHNQYEAEKLAAPQKRNNAHRQRRPGTVNLFDRPLPRDESMPGGSQIKAAAVNGLAAQRSGPPPEAHNIFSHIVGIRDLPRTVDENNAVLNGKPLIQPRQAACRRHLKRTESRFRKNSFICGNFSRKGDNGNGLAAVIDKRIRNHRFRPAVIDFF